MSEPITFYELPPSPNNVKVRIALKYKEIPFETVPVSLQDDRSAVIKATGQPLTPAIVDRGRILYDSSAILRYLDANFPEGPRLFSADKEEIHAIEKWERLGRGELAEPLKLVFEQMFAEEPDLQPCETASSWIHERTALLEDHLSSNEWLVGNRMTAADITCGVVLSYAMIAPAFVESFAPAKFFADNYKLGEGREETRAWVNRILAYDN